MKDGHAVIGANYGDEGKGLLTDYLCSQGADLVVRFNGGAQAGHTVTTPDGRRHVFHHYGSGGFCDTPTFLSKFFVINPLLFDTEQLVSNAKVYVDPHAIVTTPFDMLINQNKTRGRSISCGVGLNETMQRSKRKARCLFVYDMLNPEILDRIEGDFACEDLDSVVGGWRNAHWRKVYLDCANNFLESVVVTEQPPGNNLVFEGAQGLMLDQDSPDFPFVTHSHTGMRNVHVLCADLNVEEITATYVTRSYLTRHGKGPLPDEEPMPDFVRDATNVDNEYQGPLRYAPLNILELERRVIKDAYGMKNVDLAITCMDQFLLRDKFTLPVKYASYGPTRDHVMEDEEVIT